MIRTPEYTGIVQQLNQNLVEEQSSPISTFNDVYKSPYVAPEEYSFSESVGAGFRQYTGFQALSRLIENTDFEDDPSYDPMQDPQVPEGYEWRFLNSSSAYETTVRLERLQEDLKDLEIIENGNILGVGLGGLLSPLTLAPLGTFKTLTQASFLKRFVGSAAFTTALYAPEEFLIASQSEGRTELGQTLVPLVGAGIIGGTIGGLFGKRIAGNMRPADDFAQEGEEGIFRSVGASADEGSPQNLRRSMDNEALEETGINLEKLKWNPVTRLTQVSYKRKSREVRLLVNQWINLLKQHLEALILAHYWIQ
jgi:hypothetical protein